MGYYDSYHRRKEQNIEATEEAETRAADAKRAQYTQLGASVGLELSNSLFKAREQNAEESYNLLGKQVGGLTGEDYKGISSGTNLYSKKGGRMASLTGNTVEGMNPDVINTLMGDQMKGQNISQQQAIMKGDMTELYGSNVAEAYMSGGEKMPGIKAFTQRMIPGGESGKSKPWSPESATRPVSLRMPDKDSGGVQSPDYVKPVDSVEPESMTAKLRSQRVTDDKEALLVKTEYNAIFRGMDEREDAVNKELTETMQGKAIDDFNKTWDEDELVKKQQSIIDAESAAMTVSDRIDSEKDVRMKEMNPAGFVYGEKKPLTSGNTLGKALERSQGGKKSIDSAVKGMRDIKSEDTKKAMELFPDSDPKSALDKYYNYEDSAGLITDANANSIEDLNKLLGPDEAEISTPEKNVESVSQKIMENTQESLASKALSTAGDVQSAVSTVQNVKKVFSSDAKDSEKFVAGSNVAKAASTKVVKKQTEKFMTKKVEEIAAKKLEKKAAQKLTEEAAKKAATTGGTALGTAAKGVGGAAAAVTGFYAMSEGVKGYKDAEKRGDTDEQIAQGVVAAGGAVAGTGGVLMGLGAILTATGVGAVVGAPLMAIGGTMTTYGGVAATAGSMYTMAENALEKPQSLSIADESISRSTSTGRSLGRGFSRA